MCSIGVCYPLHEPQATWVLYLYCTVIINWIDTCGNTRQSRVFPGFTRQSRVFVRYIRYSDVEIKIQKGLWCFFAFVTSKAFKVTISRFFLFVWYWQDKQVFVFLSLCVRFVTQRPRCQAKAHDDASAIYWFATTRYWFCCFSCVFRDCPVQSRNARSEIARWNSNGTT